MGLFGYPNKKKDVSFGDIHIVVDAILLLLQVRTFNYQNKKKEVFVWSFQTFT